MKKYIAQLQRIHFAWFGLGVLWILGFYSISYSINDTTPAYWNVALGYAERDRSPETRAAIYFFAYLIGGAILGIVHERHTARFANAGYTLEKKDGGVAITVLPARRHLPFWLFGLFGGIFMFSIPYMLSGNGFGTFFTLACGGTFLLIGLHPKLWMPLGLQVFEVSPDVIKARGKSVAMKDVQGMFIGNFIRDKDAVQQQMYYTPQSQHETVVYGTPGQVLAAQGMAAAQRLGLDASMAAGNGIAEIAKRYAREMRARSFQIEAVLQGKNLILAKGLDENTAQALMTEIKQAVENNDPARATA